jgi:hypothetical protein
MIYVYQNQCPSSLVLLQHRQNVAAMLTSLLKELDRLFETGKSTDDGGIIQAMVDWREHKRAHKLEMCPACGGTMRLGRDTYTCENKDCGHFAQDPSLHDIVERDDPSNLRFCNCRYCLEQRGGQRL